MQFVKRLAEFTATISGINSATSVAVKSTANRGLQKQRNMVLKDSQFATLLPLLQLIYDPHKPFHITADGILKYEQQQKNKGQQESINYTDFKSLLEDLSSRRLTGNTAYDAALSFINAHPPEYRQLLLNAIDKNLKLRISLDSINRAIGSEGTEVPRHHHRFSIALANLYSERQHSIQQSDWFVSRKFDGVRCLMHMLPSQNSVYALSRHGRMLNVDWITESIQRNILNTCKQDMVLDGELCHFSSSNDGSQMDNFHQTISIISSLNERQQSNEQKSDLLFVAFDCLEMEEFKRHRSDRRLSERFTFMDSFVTNDSITASTINGLGTGFFRPLGTSIPLAFARQVRLNGVEHLNELFAESTRLGWEGLMLRRDVGYRAGRSNDLLKVKQAMDAEFRVLDIQLAPMRLYVDGRETEGEALASVEIEHKGNRVRVGSGFTTKQRLEFARDPQRILGHQITVQYAGETKSSSPSLRFPVFKHLWGAGGRKL